MSSRPPKGRIIVFGIAFWYPLAGVTWQFLHYLVGLRRLGYDAFYVEDCPRMVYDPVLNDYSMDASANVRAIAPVLEKYGFADRWVFRGLDGRCHGMSEDQLAALYRDADACLNVTGSQEIGEQHMRIPRRIYVETDPVASQILAAAGHEKTVTQLSAHHVLFSYGENIGQPDCLLPKSRSTWLPTRQPVVLDFWKTDRPGGDRYTTIATWRNKGKDILYNSETYYWSKDREFEKFIDLPTRTKERFELACSVDEAAGRTLTENRWGLADPFAVSCNLYDYRAYVQKSRAEFTVAKDQNIRLRSGWFSDRSACYLAAGRPVITQETGFSRFLPTGRGLFGFLTTEAILDAIDTIERDYAGACRTAREIAGEYFDAEKVLANLMSRAGL